MTKHEALTILTEQQKWRRAEPPYEYDQRSMPYTPKKYGEAIDYAIKFLKEEKRYEY